MQKRLSSVPIVLCAALLLSGCGTPKPGTPGQTQTAQQKALKADDDIRASARTFSDSYMTYYRNRLAQLKADKALTGHQRYVAIKALNAQAGAINEIYGKAIDLEGQAATIIQNNANLTGSPAAQALSLIQQIVILFNDPILAGVGDATFHTVVTAAQLTIQTLVGILQLQSRAGGFCTGFGEETVVCGPLVGTKGGN